MGKNSKPGLTWKTHGYLLYLFERCKTDRCVYDHNGDQKHIPKSNAIKLHRLVLELTSLIGHSYKDEVIT
jgi:hypothetical protein